MVAGTGRLLRQGMSRQMDEYQRQVEIEGVEAASRTLIEIG